MSSTQEASGTARPSRPVRPIPVLIAVLVLADIVSAFESTMMFNALPRIIGAFHTTPADASWVLTAFLLVAAASAAVCGRLGDLYGRRNVIIVLLLISAVGSVISVSTGTLTGVIAGRAVQGVSGGILPLCFGVAREILPKKHAPVAAAMIAGAAMLAGAAGNIISGALIDTLDWHYIFVVAAAVAVIAAAGCLLLPRSRVVAGARRVSWFGSVLFAPAIGLVLFGVNKSSSWGWSDGRTLGTIVTGLLLLALWVWRELRVDHPMINLRLFSDRKVALTMLATAVLAIGPVGATGFLLQIIMQTPTDAPVGLGLSATDAGWVSFCIAIFGFLLSPLSGRISARAGSRRALIIGSVFGVINAATLAMLHSTLMGLIISTVFLTVATSFILSSLPNLIMEAAPVENTSEATGLNVVVRTTFSGVGTSVATLLLSMSLVSGTHFSTRGAYMQVFVLIGISCAVALILALLIRPGVRAASGAAPAVAASKA
ncbi:MFS transporter [Streptomyces paludis]|uniref:MFS transporter n=1 Tax=Streptomyces paludis TaxID=2282738 RepID=A0A345HXM0_9ACTN|nr:MFS transporter [Streptomyces paludis]AXG81444.1 MFS transporter [Streptomyces paludis]